jgi:hypothetical protein
VHTRGIALAARQEQHETCLHESSMLCLRHLEQLLLHLWGQGLGGSVVQLHMQIRSEPAHLFDCIYDLALNMYAANKWRC